MMGEWVMRGEELQEIAQTGIDFDAKAVKLAAALGCEYREARALVWATLDSLIDSAALGMLPR